MWLLAPRLVMLSPSTFPPASRGWDFFSVREADPGPEVCHRIKSTRFQFGVGGSAEREGLGCIQPRRLESGRPRRALGRVPGALPKVDKALRTRARTRNYFGQLRDLISIWNHRGSAGLMIMSTSAAVLGPAESVLNRARKLVRVVPRPATGAVVSSGCPMLMLPESKLQGRSPAVGVAGVSWWRALADRAAITVVAVGGALGLVQVAQLVTLLFS